MLDRINDVFIANLKARMAALRLKVPALAKRTGLSASGLYGVLDGTNWPQPDNLDRIARGLDTTVAALFAGPDDSVPNPTAMQMLEFLKKSLNDPATFDLIVAAISSSPPERR